MQRLRGAPRRGHEHADLGEGGACRVAHVRQVLLHVAQVGAAVARLVLRQQPIDVLDHWLAVPLGSAPVPVVEADLAAEMHGQRLERRRRIELEADLVQFLLRGHQVRAEAAQVLHEHERVLLFLVEPHAHERGEVGIVAVVAQEHLGGRERRPLGDRVHLDGARLLVGQLRCVELCPGNVLFHAPADGLEGLEQIGIEHRHGGVLWQLASPLGPARLSGGPVLQPAHQAPDDGEFGIQFLGGIPIIAVLRYAPARRRSESA